MLQPALKNHSRGVPPLPRHSFDSGRLVSLIMLWQERVVHGDLKPENVLVGTSHGRQVRSGPHRSANQAEASAALEEALTTLMPSADPQCVPGAQGCGFRACMCCLDQQGRADEKGLGRILQVARAGEVESVRDKGRHVGVGLHAGRGAAGAALASTTLG